jgi:hypothetical protein
MARPDKYYTDVEPYLKEITQMCHEMTERQIAETLNVGYSTFRRYKDNHSELSAALKKGKKELIIELKSSLIQKAKGFEYEESKEIKQAGKPTKTEVYHRRALPDVAAINLLLKNLDPDWANDPQMVELRRKELELQEKKIEQNEW